MNDLTVIEIKAFVPARDFVRSKRFYVDLGFELAWSDENLAYLRHGEASFLLQDFFEPADNFMMHMLVKDVDAWWRRVQAQDLVGKYGVMAQPPEDRPWGLRDFVLTDPTSVLWRIGQNIQTKPPLSADATHDANALASKAPPAPKTSAAATH